MPYATPVWVGHPHVMSSTILICVQVALFQGLDADAKAELSKGVRDGGQHLNKLLKVLTVRNELNHERSGITLLGGPHNSELDGQVTGSYVPLIALQKAHLACKVNGRT